MNRSRLVLGFLVCLALAVSASPAAAQDKPNILVIWGDDIGTWNISHNNRGMMGYETPNIDRIAEEGISFTDYYAQQSCTAGRAAFMGGTVPVRTGMTKVGLPGAAEGWQEQDITIAAVLKEQGYATGQFGKNHFGDRDEHLPTNHGFDEFYGPLYHLNASEEPEHRDYPRDYVLPSGKTFFEQYGPRGVIDAKANADGTQTIEDTGQLTKKRMETIDDETVAAAKDFIKRQEAAGKPWFVLVERDADALPNPRQGRAHRPRRTLRRRVPRRHGRARHACRRAARTARRARHRREHDRPILHRQRARTSTPGRTRATRRSARRRTPTGRAPTGCRHSSAGRRSGLPARPSTASSPTRTGWSPSPPPRARTTSRRTCSTATRPSGEPIASISTATT